MADGEKVVRVVMQFAADQAGLTQTKQGLDKVQQEADKVSENYKKGTDQASGQAKAVKSLGEKMGELQTIGIKLGAAGAAITGPLIAAANSYVQAVNVTTTTGKRWLAATYEIETSWQSIGKDVSGILVPALEQVANLTAAAAGYLDKHQDVLKFALGAGGILTVAGGGAVAVTQLYNTVKALQGLGWISSGATAAGAAGAGGAGAAAAGGAGAGIVGTVAGPLIAGTLIATILAGLTAEAGHVFLNSPFGQSVVNGVTTVMGTPDPNKMFGGGGGQGVSQAVQDLQKDAFLPFKKVATLLAGVVGWFTGGSAGAKANESAVGGALGTTPGAAAGAGGTSDPNAAMSATMKEYGMAYLQYVIQEQQAARQYHLSVGRETRDFYLQQQYAQEDYQKQVGRSQRDFTIQLAQDEKMFQRQRSLAARDYYISVSRAEYDFQKSQKRAGEDHQWSLFNIIRSGDAMAYFEEQRQFNLGKSRETEDFNLQQQRNAQDFQRQQADDQTNHDIERAFSQKQFAIQMADAATDYKIQRDRNLQQFSIRLADQAIDFQMQEDQRQKAFNLQLVNMQGDLQKVGYLWSTLTVYMQNDLVNRINDLGAGSLSLIPNPAVPQFALGGYAPDGIIRTHAGEFILRADVANLAEKITSRSLDQDTILSLMKNGVNGGGKTLEYHDNRVFSRGMTSEDRQRTRQDSRNMVLEAFSL